MRFIPGWKRGKSHSDFRIIGILLGLAFPSVYAGTFSGRVAGRWLAPAHMSSEPAAAISISVEGDTLSGYIDSLLTRPADSRCAKCKGERKGMPIVGMPILKGFTFQGGQWVGGYILDPESGREFRAEISPTGDPKRLKVRGYMGWKWLGKDIYWTRLE